MHREKRKKSNLNEFVLATTSFSGITQFWLEKHRIISLGTNSCNPDLYQNELSDFNKSWGKVIAICTFYLCGLCTKFNPYKEKARIVYHQDNLTEYIAGTL